MNPTPPDSLRQEIRRMLIDYDGAGYPDPHIDDWMQLVTREKKRAVEEAFAHIDAWRCGGVDDLVPFERSTGHHDVVKQFPRILSTMFPSHQPPSVQES